MKGDRLKSATSSIPVIYSGTQRSFMWPADHQLYIFTVLLFCLAADFTRILLVLLCFPQFSTKAMSIYQSPETVLDATCLFLRISRSRFSVPLVRTIQHQTGQEPQAALKGWIVIQSLCKKRIWATFRRRNRTYKEFPWICSECLQLWKASPLLMLRQVAEP